MTVANFPFHAIAFALSILALPATPALSQDWSYRGSLGFEGRLYDSDGDSDSNDTQLSAKGVLNAKYEKGRYQANLGLLAREAFVDPSRDFHALTDTYFGFYKGDWVFSAGSKIYNWRVLEVFTAVDTLNARNYDSTDETERIGLPSLSLTKEFESSFFQAIYIPVTLPSKFTQQNNRQGLLIELDAPEFVSDDFKSSGGDHIFQYVLRFKKSFDALELDLHYARKFDTFYPIIAIDVPSAPTADPDELNIRPYFFPARQAAASLQGNYGEWIWKLEAANIDFDNYKVAFYVPPVDVTKISQTDHTRAAAGVERTFYFANNHSGSLFLEYTHVFSANQEEADLLGAFIRDAAVGYRHQLNDFKRHEFSLFAVKDTLTGNEAIYSAGHEFAPVPAWKLSTTITVIDAPKPDRSNPLDFIYGLRPIRDSDNILMVLTRFF